MTNTVEKITIIGSSEGLDTLEHGLNRVADAQDNLAGATKATETVVERSSRSVASAAKAYDRVLQKADPVYRAEQQIAKGVAAADRAFQLQIISATEHARALDLLASQHRKLDASNDNMIGSATQAVSVFDRLRASVSLAGDHAAEAQGKFAKAASVLAQFRGLAAGAAGAVGLGGGLALGSIIGTTAEFQKLQASLETVTGSAANAKAAMGFVREFAAKTPFDVQQVTEAFIKLKLLGLDPSAEALTSYGNTASAMGKPLMQFIEAIADATTGEFERLKQFGITAAKDGEAVALTFQGQTTTIENSAKAIEAYLRRIGDTNFAGGMDRQATQLGGALSNAQDAVANFQAAIGEGGLASAVADAARETAGFLNANHDLAAELGGLLGDFVRDVGALVDEVGAGAGHIVTKFQEAGRGIASAVAGIAATGPATVAGFMAAWDNFPDLLRAVGVAAFNTFLHLVQEAINETIGEINRLLSVVNSLGDMIGATPIELVAPVDFTGFKADMTGGAADVAATITATFEDAKAINEKAIAALFAAPEDVGEHLELKYGIRETAEAAATLGTSAAAAGVAIDDGITRPSVEAARALRDADAAKKALFSEADAAVGEFFPMAKAEEEAARLTAMIQDASNGLSDLQRQALGLQIAKNFDDARPKVEALRASGTQAAEDIGQAFIANVGDVFADVFSQATRDGEDFFGSLLKSFAGLGSQLAAAGGKNLLGQLFGTNDPKAASAAGIGGLLGGAGSGATGGSFAGESSFGQFSSSPLMALNDNLAKTSRSALDVAKQFSGLNERADTKVLDGFLRASGNWGNLSAKDTAWCAAFANAAISQTGGQGTGSNLASSFMGWGTGTNAPKIGDIVVLKPQSSRASGHVGFVAGFGDGTVQVFGGNQSGGANTKSFGTDQVRGYRTAGIPTEDYAATQRLFAKGVSQGMTEFSRREGPQMSSQAQAAMNAGWDGFSHNGASQGTTGAQRGFGAIGAGLGIFGQGYESGSPLSGGVSGALGGFQAAQALGVAGPIGMVAGAALGILGGVLGGRAKRKAAHKEAAAKWAEARPAYEAFDRSLSGEGVGQLRAQNEELWGQLNSFMQVGGAAWKMGSGNSSAQFASTGTKMFQKIHDSMKEFREGFSYMLEDLMGGEGLEGAFAKGRANVKALGEQVKGFIDDVEIAWGSADNGLPTGAPGDAIDKEWKSVRDAAVEKAKAAAGAYALTMLYTADTTSDVQKAIDSFRGTAAGLQPILEQLGWTAEEAAKAMDERLTQALTKMRGDFEEGIADEVNNLDGKGYLAEVREMIEAFEQTKKDAELLGADTSLLPKLFELQGQAIVDGAELTGEAFVDLIKAFPALAGVVKEFVKETVKRTADEIAEANRQAGRSSLDLATSQLQGLYDGLGRFSDSIRDFLDDMLIGESSTLSDKDQLAESRRIYEETLAKANGGDGEARDALLGVTQDYLDKAKDYYVSSQAYGAIFDEVQASLKATDVKTMSQLDLMRSSASWLEKINTSTLSVAQALQDYLAAEKTLNTARSWGDPGYENRNKAIIGDLTKAGINYTGDFGGGKFLDWTNAQLPSQQSIINAIVEKYDRQFQLNGYDPKYQGTPLYKGMQRGGLVGAYAEGGIVGNGIWNRDSVVARYAGGGHIGLAGGEFVMPAPRVTPATMPILEGLRSGQIPGNDNAAIAAELRALRADNARLLGLIATTTGNGFRETVSATERGNRSAEQTALAARRGVTNKQAAG